MNDHSNPALQDVTEIGAVKTPSAKTQAIQDACAVLGRWLLGGLFIYMGMSKALHPEQFLKLLRQYDMTANPFVLNSIASALPWFEVFCGLLLLLGVAVRGGALVVSIMLTCFTFAVLERALHIAGAEGLPFTAVKFDCGCGSGEVLAWRKLIENSLLILLGLWVVTGRRRRFCVRHSLAKREQNPMAGGQRPA